MASSSTSTSPPLAALAPDRVFHVGGLSKAVAAGLRGGWVACPPNFAGRVSVAHKMMTGGKPFLLTEIAARLVLSGDAVRIPDRDPRRDRSRVALAREAFAGLDVSHPRPRALCLADVARAVALGRLQERRREESILDRRRG